MNVNLSKSMKCPQYTTIKLIFCIIKFKLTKNHINGKSSYIQSPQTRYFNNLLT